METETPSGPNVDVLMDVAWRYYVSGQAQHEIATELALDPSTVSRYLKRARAEGIVHIEIKRPQQVDDSLGRQLANHFNLKRAVIVPDTGDIASTAAEFVANKLTHGMRIGLSWGRSLASTVHAMPAGVVSDLQLSVLHGGLDSEGTGVQGHELARYFASLYPGSRAQYLQAPLLVDSPDIKAAMLRDGSIRRALAAAAEVELALVGVGTLDPSAPLVQYRHLAPDSVQNLANAGGVGDIATRFFNVEGTPLHNLDDRLIALDWEALQRVPNVIAVAGGALKSSALLGALRTGLIDELVTDAPTIKETMRLAGISALDASPAAAR